MLIDRPLDNIGPLVCLDCCNKLLAIMKTRIRKSSNKLRSARRRRDSLLLDGPCARRTRLYAARSRMVQALKVAEVYQGGEETFVDAATRPAGRFSCLHARDPIPGVVLECECALGI